MWSKSLDRCLYEGYKSRGARKEIHFRQLESRNRVLLISVPSVFHRIIFRTKNMKEAMRLFSASISSEFVLLVSLERDDEMVHSLIFFQHRNHLSVRITCKNWRMLMRCYQQKRAKRFAPS